MARAAESDLYQHAAKIAAAVRVTVADQMRDLIADGTMNGSRGEMTARLERVLAVERQIAEAKGRQQQAREEGLPVQRHVLAEIEGRALLRDAVMAMGAACGQWVVSIDFDERRKVDGRLNGTTRAREREDADGESGE